VCSDDGSNDGTTEILAGHAADDARIVLRRSESRRGLIENWRLAFALAREVRPDARYFAWASDHDIWHPEWLERLVSELETHPEAALAYPLNTGIDDSGKAIREPWRFDTAGLRSVPRRIETAVQGMVPGSMVYGLYRAEALERCGVYRAVIVPDRLLLSELALYGEFRQVPEVLWSRRFRQGVKVTARRQRRAFFPDRPPLYSYLPWPLMHTGALAWNLVVRGTGRPQYGRAAGAAFTGWYAVRASALAAYRRARTVGHHAKRWAARTRDDRTI
jgi:glycosyltransferase involved in cell wall biosynthesis